MDNLRYRRDLQDCNTRNKDKVDQPYCRLSKTAFQIWPSRCLTQNGDIRSQPTHVVFVRNVLGVYSVKEFFEDPALV